MNITSPLAKEQSFFARHKFWGSYWIWYTGFFVITCVLVYWAFFVTNTSMVWRGDGVAQHYPFLKYFNQYARDFIKSILSGSPDLPQWDASMGLGADIVASVANAGLFDPLNYLAILTPGKYMPYMYDFLAFLRMYLAGLAFSALCYHWKKPRAHILIGALSYVFCGFALYVASRHPFFVNPMIYLPLLLLGWEKLMVGRRPLLFVTITALSAVINFYFFFMLSVLLFVYACFRFFTFYRENRWKQFGILFGRSVGYYLIGVAMACVVLLPMAYAVLHSNRGANGYTTNFVVYPFIYYFKCFVDFISTSRTSGDWTILGYTPLVLVAVVLLFTHRDRESRLLRRLFFVAVAMLSIPFIGYLMAATSYVANRWCFAVALLMCCILVDRLPLFCKLERRDAVALGGVFAVYCLLVLLIRPLNTLNSWVGIGMFGLCLAVLAVLNLRGTPKRFRINRKQWVQCSFCAVTVLCLAVHGTMRFDVNEGAYLKENVSNHSGKYDNFVKTSAGLIRSIEDSGFYRVEVAEGKLRNDALSQGYHGTSMFYSMNDNRINQYYDEMALSSRKNNWTFEDLNYRTAQMGLWGVKYFVGKPNEDEGIMPYGFSLVKTTRDYGLYQNQHWLPLGYTYSQYLTREQYDRLPPVLRQEAVLSAAMLECAPEGLPQASQEQLGLSGVADTPFEIVETSGLEIKDGKIIIKKGGAKMKLQFKTPAGCENYLEMTGVSFEGYVPREHIELYLGENPSRLEKREFYQDYAVSQAPDMLVVSASSSRGKTQNSLLRPNNDYYFEKNEMVFHLGYSADSVKECILTFNVRGELMYEDIRLYSVRMDGYGDKIDALKQDVLENIRQSGNDISGTIDLAEPKLLCISMPYSEGWRATVDGRVQELLPVNSLAMGLMLDAGSHEIELHYRTPLLRTGAVVSVAAVAVYYTAELVLFLVRRRKGGA